MKNNMERKVISGVVTKVFSVW